MKKQDVTNLLGTNYRVAKMIGIDRSVVGRWGDILKPYQADRVIAACWRHNIDPSMLGATKAV